MPDDPNRPAELTRFLSTQERQRIQARIDHLEAALEIRDTEALRRAVGGMLLSFPSGRATGEEARIVVAAYVNAVSDQPPWAVNEAAKKWSRGEAGGKPTFPPSSAELHQVADRQLVPVRAEIHWLKRALAGVTVDRRQPVQSRTRRAMIESHAKSIASRLALEQRASELGLDPKAALAEIPDAPPRLGDMQQIGHVAMAELPARKPATDEGQTP
jgi:hypothetical protein